MKLNRYTVYPGRHTFKLWGRVWGPPCIKRKVKRIEWVVRFTESCRYTLDNGDQDDWNKGGGVSFDLLTNHTDSAMWAWRWNPERQVIQLSTYCHVDGGVLKARTALGPDQTSPEVVAEVEIGQTVDISLRIEHDRYAFTFETAEGTSNYWTPHNHDKKLARTIGAWFGGNRQAPQRIDIYLTRKID